MVPQSVLTQELVLRICREYRIMSCDIIAREDATVDQLLDVIEVYLSYFKYLSEEFNHNSRCFDREIVVISQESMF